MSEDEVTHPVRKAFSSPIQPSAFFGASVDSPPEPQAVATELLVAAAAAAAAAEDEDDDDDEEGEGVETQAFVRNLRAGIEDIPLVEEETQLSQASVEKEAPATQVKGAGGTQRNRRGTRLDSEEVAPPSIGIHGDPVEGSRVTRSSAKKVVSVKKAGKQKEVADQNQPIQTPRAKRLNPAQARAAILQPKASKHASQIPFDTPPDTLRAIVEDAEDESDLDGPRIEAPSNSSDRMLFLLQRLHNFVVAHSAVHNGKLDVPTAWKLYCQCSGDENVMLARIKPYARRSEDEQRLINIEMWNSVDDATLIDLEPDALAKIVSRRGSTAVNQRITWLKAYGCL